MASPQTTAPTADAAAGVSTTVDAGISSAAGIVSCSNQACAAAGPLKHTCYEGGAFLSCAICVEGDAPLVAYCSQLCAFSHYNEHLEEVPLLRRIAAARSSGASFSEVVEAQVAYCELLEAHGKFAASERVRLSVCELLDANALGSDAATRAKVAHATAVISVHKERYVKKSHDHAVAVFRSCEHLLQTTNPSLWVFAFYHDLARLLHNVVDASNLLSLTRSLETPLRLRIQSSCARILASGDAAALSRGKEVIEGILGEYEQQREEGDTLSTDHRNALVDCACILLESVTREYNTPLVRSRLSERALADAHRAAGYLALEYDLRRTRSAELTTTPVRLLPILEVAVKLAAAYRFIGNANAWKLADFARGFAVPRYGGEHARIAEEAQQLIEALNAEAVEIERRAEASQKEEARMKARAVSLGGRRAREEGCRGEMGGGGDGSGGAADDGESEP